MRLWEWLTARDRPWRERRRRERDPELAEVRVEYARAVPRVTRLTRELERLETELRRR